MRDIDLSSFDSIPTKVDREKIHAHVAKLDGEGFFDNFSEEQKVSIKKFLGFRVYCASLMYYLLRAESEQLTINANILQNMKTLENAIDKISEELRRLQKKHSAEFVQLSDDFVLILADTCAGSDAHYWRIKNDLSALDLLRLTGALKRTVGYWNHRHPGKEGRGAPAKHHDEGLIRSLAPIYERITGAQAGVSAPPGGKIAKGPFVRFLEGWLRVIDPNRKNQPSKSFIQRALTEYRATEKEIRDFNQTHSTLL